ncbi:MAG: hypothetical protein EXR53_03515 [Dehalococcoidia bacterium]|nr:hypothetical protein [Dehalococcoidia bacterium]
MSKLLERLDRIAKGAAPAMGFGPQGNREPVPTLALLAWLTGTNQRRNSTVAKAGLDAIVLPGAPAGTTGTAQQLKSPEGAVWGVAVVETGQESLQAYKEQGCDFLVFGIEGTRVDALEEGPCARILRIPADLPESQLRGLEDLPVDIVILCKPAPEGPLSLAHLLAISNVRSATGRYLLLEWDAELTARELEQLRDMGVDGLVITAEESQSQTIKTLRQRIDALPRRKPRGEQRSVPLLPRVGGLESARPRRHEEEEEEDDDGWDEP